MEISACQLGPPVDLRPLFAPQRDQLCWLFDGLSVDEWARPTVCHGWTVADLAGHVLGDLLGRISGMRDRAQGKQPHPGEPTGRFIDRVNGEWVVGARQLSPALVVDLLRWAGPIHDEMWQSRALEEPSLGVSWAGVDPAPLWLDAARDVSEYWVHEQQLRAATGRGRPTVPDVDTILDVFVRGLPFTLGSQLVGATSVTIGVDPEGPEWTLRTTEGRWQLVDGDGCGADAYVRFDRDALWKRWARQPVTAVAPADRLARTVWNHVAILHSEPDTD